MAKGLFKNLPLITYNERIARNIMVSSRIVRDVFSDPVAFFNYTVKDNETPEEIARRFYGSIHYSWVVLLANNIVDVHSDWPKSYRQLTDFLVDKYGSIPASQSEIIHYENPKYSFTINEDTHTRYANTSYVDSTITIDRTGWSAVSAYTYHETRNDNQRNIRLLDPSLIDVVKEEVERLFDG